jgi:acetyltransferase-like isoleucine patch superfamily enzyme
VLSVATLASGARGRAARLAQQRRVAKYRLLSTCRNVHGTATILQPLLLLGEGTITLGVGVEFGWRTSRAFHTGYCHLEATTPAASIRIGDGVQINNNAFFKSEGPGIAIGDRCLLGSEVTIYDSDFHDLRPGRRRGGSPRMAAVELEQDVFVGDRVTILKGVRVGAGSVIGAGSVVSSSIPPGVIAAGNPARILRQVPGPTGAPASLEMAQR